MLTVLEPTNFSACTVENAIKVLFIWLAAVVGGGGTEAASLMPSTSLLGVNNLTLITRDALRFPTFHVQGLSVTEDVYYVTAVDTEKRRGWLFKVDRNSGTLLQQKELTDGARIHPGGIQFDGTHLWVSNAENRRNSSTKVLAINPQTLDVSRSFTVQDHIGLVASNGKDRLYGANWDTVYFYVWDWDGNLIERVANPTGLAYQDCEFIEPYLLCGGLNTKDRSVGAIDLIDVESWTLVHRIPVGKTDLGLALTHEGISFFGSNVYFLPEDDPNSEVLIYQPEI